MAAANVVGLAALLAMLRPGPEGRPAKISCLAAAPATGPATAAAPRRQTGVLLVVSLALLGGAGRVGEDV